MDELLTLLEETGPLRISFEDLTGVLADVKEMTLSVPHRVHACDFCMLAKSHRLTHRDCIDNKRATNRIAARKMKGYCGQCHLGITDIVEPFIYKERVMGIFYYGSIVVRGTEELARARICRYCARRNINPAPFLSQLKTVPKIEPGDLAKYHDRLRLVARLCVQMMDAYGLPMDRFRTEFDAHRVAQKRLHALAQAAIRHIHLNYIRNLSLAEVAKHVKCHPNHLSRVMKKQFSCGFSEYVQRVRIDHARRLISVKRFSLGEIAFQVGFSDQSYFNKTFKSLVGCTPGEYAEKGEAAEAPKAKEAERPTLSFAGDTQHFGREQSASSSQRRLNSRRR